MKQSGNMLIHTLFSGGLIAAPLIPLLVFFMVYIALRAYALREITWSISRFARTRTVK